MSPNIRKRILIKGVVQGVGFRPHVYRLAVARRLSGWVKNDASGVTIEAQGAAENVKLFINELVSRKPAAAAIDSLRSSDITRAADTDFTIIKSGGNIKAEARIPADLALCPDCRRELSNPSDRRYLYPFTNCTKCGPRFTIVKNIPYDRPLTTMKGFKMCPGCLAEYRDPLNRRFHAQPNACPVCGPSLSARYKGRMIRGLAALELAAELLAKGKIVALQSLGGFHLACDASNRKSILKLRRFKDRPAKPFAVMTESAAEAGKLCFVSIAERKILESISAPVVMLRKKKTGVLAQAAPGLAALGVMTAYTPLHAALFRLLRGAGFKSPLVMTSGNRRDEPIAKDLAGAEEAFGAAADLIVCHDREIHNRADDSVGFYADGAFRLVRRARGYVPDAVRLGGWAAGQLGGQTVLGCGADLKTAFCLTRGAAAFLSQHIGDQSEYANQKFYVETIVKMKALLRVSPGVIAHDLHPDYHSSNYGRSLKGAKVPVQHHVAHVLSAAAEHSINRPFIGVAWDGTGYGTDGKIWGSEFFVVKGNTWRRAAHLKYFPLPGGDAAARHIWRSALSLLMNTLGPAWRGEAGRLFRGLDRKTVEAVERMTAKGVNAPLTSSMGRLFDAVSFIAGLGPEATYEGQGPMELESLCVKPSARPYSFDISRQDGVFLIDPAKVLAAALRERGAARARHISERFHAGLAGMLADTVLAISRGSGIKTVVLSGGVFQNRTLLECGMKSLRQKGFTVFANEKVPANDGGIALGQVYYALNRFRQI
jgi:hydrogenase maturation protein HypF